jgi:hypothetical protein
MEKKRVLCEVGTEYSEYIGAEEEDDDFCDIKSCMERVQEAATLEI